MDDLRTRRLVAVAVAAMGVLGIGLLLAGAEPIPRVLMWAAVFAIAHSLTVPTSSGQRLFLGLGVAGAAALLLDDPVALTAAISLGLPIAWSGLILREHEEAFNIARLASEIVALLAFVGFFELVAGSLSTSNLEGTWAGLVAVLGGGTGWFLARASTLALGGLERKDLSVRYLWLLALEDWAAVVSLIATGALFGLSFPVMRWWALPLALMPYGFSHLAFVRYHGTRVTYYQTIRALSRIPEVGGLSPEGHSTRTAELAVAVAREMGLHPDAVAELEYAALMHDIGRVTLNEPAILKAGYTDEDIARWGSQIIAEAPYLRRAAEIVQEQYRPYRSPGVERDPDLPIAAQIIKVASAYDRAVHELHLRPVVALEQLHQGAAYEYSPEVTGSLRRVLVHRGTLSV